MRSLSKASALSSDIGGWINEWASAWSVSDLSCLVRVEFSGRLTRALGRCTPETDSIRLLGSPMLSLGSMRMSSYFE
jgi:hypothetical protein